MKKLLLILLISSIAISIFSCDDSVNPKAGFEEVYILNCIIRSDTSYQVATISHSFDVEGYDPYTNENDPFIKDAQIKLFYNNSVFVMSDSSAPRTDNSRYKTQQNFYYTKSFKPMYNRPMKIEAVLPNGKILTAESDVLTLNSIHVYSTDKKISLNNTQDVIGFNWGRLNTSSDNKGVYFSPELVILYAYEKNNVVENLQKKIPLYYINGETPVYPQIETEIQSCTFEMDVVNRAMAEISGGDLQKGNYKINKAVFRLLVMDAGLAAYYSTQKTFLDEFSMRVNQPDASNIQGGLGVFGSYSVKQVNIELTTDYVESFGYQKK
ncbi:MAG: DUF4249 family protein [Ignavibacteriales bacterium]|nr:DUF4249 family protein [Ignavibacteriales bacterium]